MLLTKITVTSGSTHRAISLALLKLLSSLRDDTIQTTISFLLKVRSGVKPSSGRWIKLACFREIQNGRQERTGALRREGCMVGYGAAKHTSQTVFHVRVAAFVRDKRREWVTKAA